MPIKYNPLLSQGFQEYTDPVPYASVFIGSCTLPATGSVTTTVTAGTLNSGDSIFCSVLGIPAILSRSGSTVTLKRFLPAAASTSIPNGTEVKGAVFTLQSFPLVSDATIPASGSVNVLIDLPSGYDPPTGQAFTVSIVGITGTLVKTSTSQQWTFTRTTAGSSTSILAARDYFTLIGTGVLSSSQNLVSDPYNEAADPLTLRRNNRTAWINFSNLSIATGNANNPYPSPALVNLGTGTGTVGEIYYLSELGLKIGDTVTAALEVYTPSGTSAQFQVVLANSSLAAITSASSSVFSGGGFTLLSAPSAVIPANCTNIQLRLIRTGAAADQLICSSAIYRSETLGATIQNLSGASERILRSPQVNICPDPFNDLANIKGFSNSPKTAWKNETKLSIALNDTDNPYDSPAVLLNGGVGASGGRVLWLNELKAQVGDYLSFSINAFCPTGATVAIQVVFRDSGAASLGSNLSFAASTGFQTISLPALKVPANTSYIEMLGYRSAGTAALKIFAWGVFFGRIAYPIAVQSSRVDITGAEALINQNLYYQQTLVSPTNAIPGLPSSTGAPTAVSTVTGWAVRQQLGSDVTFNVLEVVPYAAAPASGIGLQVRGSDALSVLTSTTVDKETWDLNIGKKLRVLLNARITITSGTTFYLMQHGFGTPLGYNSMALAVNTERFYTNTNTAPQTRVLTATPSLTTLVPYFNVFDDPSATKRLKFKLESDQLPSTLSTGGTATTISLPRKTFALMGGTGTPTAIEEFSLYNQPMVPLLKADEVLDFAATLGRQLRECYRFQAGNTADTENPTTVGQTISVTATVKSRLTGNTISTATTTVEVVSPSTPTTAARLICIGDSITYDSSPTAAKKYPSRTRDRVPNLTLAGTRTSDDGTNNHEGRGGWKLSDYVVTTNTLFPRSPFAFPVGVAATDYWGDVTFWAAVVNTPTAYDFEGFQRAARGWLSSGNPFLYGTDGYPVTPTSGMVVYDPAQAVGSRFRTYNGSAWVAMGSQPAWEVNFSKYVARNSSAVGAPTHISILLGTNDILQTADDGGAFIGNMNTLLTSIRTWSTSVKILINLLMVGAPQDGWAQLSAADDFGADFARRAHEYNQAILANYDTDAALALNRYVGQMGICFDHENGYLTATSPINKYLSATTVRYIDGVHPATTTGNCGTYQMADSLGAWIQGFR